MTIYHAGSLSTAFRNGRTLLLRMPIHRRTDSAVMTAVSASRVAAKTQARVNDGDTLFIGGLIHETDEVINNKLPILGDMMGSLQSGIANEWCRAAP